MADAVFGADPEGWRTINSGRPAYELLREAVQNALDEACTSIEVTVEYADGGVNYSITDDVPGGIPDERFIWTIWLSSKQDTPNKRGRMGRGLKELISVSDWSLIVSNGCPAIEFKRYRGKWTRTSPRKVRPPAGTVIEGRCKLWKSRDVEEAVEYLRRIRPPQGVLLSVNGRNVERWEKKETETYKLKLPTVVFEDVDGERVERGPRRETDVELWPCTSLSPVAWIYEMGIPVERIDYPMSIDIGQRIPLREKRDTLTEPYRRELFAKLLDARSQAGKVDHAQMRDNHVLIAAQAPEHLSIATKQDIAHAWTNGMPYATTPEVVKQATGQHLPVASLRSLPEVVRGIVREVGTDAKQVLNERAVAMCAWVDPNKYTVEQRAFVDTWQWIAAGINRTCHVRLCTGKPSVAADFNRETRFLTVYVEVVPKVVADPFSVDALALLIHELAHWRDQENEHGMGFHSDAEHVGAEVAHFLQRNRM